MINEMGDGTSRLRVLKGSYTRVVVPEKHSRKCAWDFREQIRAMRQCGCCGIRIKNTPIASRSAK